MKIEEILRNKGHDVVTITESLSVLDAARVLVDHNIGGVVVTEGGRPTGILTERDLLRLTARTPCGLGSIQVGAVMTRELIVARPEDELADMMATGSLQVRAKTFSGRAPQRTTSSAFWRAIARGKSSPATIWI